mgnify:CR=1 FL=1
MVKRKTLLILVNVDWFFISHRLCIAQQAVKEGWRVVVVAKDTGKADEIRSNGIEFIDILSTRSGTNPFAELIIISKLSKIYKKLKPDVVHHITLKPVIYGSIIARAQKIKGVVNAISGLGYYFTNNKKGILPKLLMKMMKIIFNQERMTFLFQNHDDYTELKKANILRVFHTSYFIKGAGVDLVKFQYFPEQKNNKIIILFPARMLCNKGVKELKAVTELLKNEYFGKISFLLCGKIDDDSKDAVPIEYIRQWEEDGYVTWLGVRKDMVAIFNKCHIVVFPSYREGIPKSLIEACASGRPIVTTNAIGCKDCVDEGLNGYKVPVRSVVELAEAIEKLILSPTDRKKMGLYGRQKAVKEFDQKMVVKRHLEIYNELL